MKFDKQLMLSQCLIYIIFTVDLQYNSHLLSLIMVNNKWHIINGKFMRRFENMKNSIFLIKYRRQDKIIPANLFNQTYISY